MTGWQREWMPSGKPGIASDRRRLKKADAKKRRQEQPQCGLFGFIDLQSRRRLTDPENRTPADYCLSSPCFLPLAEVSDRVAELKALSAEDYYQAVIAPLETGERWSVIKLVQMLADDVVREVRQGPLYLAEIEIREGERVIKGGVIAQNRLENKGVWLPEHHQAASHWAREMEACRMPLFTFIDTPGAEAGAVANEQNQAHSISGLIATMADLAVPSVGVVLGIGYSGGAIPLATTNILLAVRDGLFSTIQPQGLAAIARKQKLDWKRCAQIVGVSACELKLEGVIDAVVNYSPTDGERTLTQLRGALLVALSEIEHQSHQLLASEDAVGRFYQYAGKRFAELEGSGLPARALQPRSPQTYPSIYGVAFRTLRSLSLRSRLRTRSGDLEPLAEEPAAVRGPEKKLTSRASAARFQQWLERSDKLIYEESIHRCWLRYKEARQQLGEVRSYIATLLFGHPQANYDKAVAELCAEIAFNLYNSWQRDARPNLDALTDYLRGQEEPYNCREIANDQITLLDIIRDSRFAPLVVEHCQHLKQFDVVYEKVLSHLTRFVSELSDRKTLSGAFLDELLEDAGVLQGEPRDGFALWLDQVRNASGFRDFLRTAEQWKKQQHPRLSTVAFVVASYVFEKLLPEYFAARWESRPFAGRFQPASIGRRKDFWNQLKQATIDLRIQAVLNEIKPAHLFTPDRLLEQFFVDFEELDADLTTADPCRFPGYAATIAQQREQKRSTSGLITGIARVRSGGHSLPVGVFVSNHVFQAGAFDMASAERLCRLLAYCDTLSRPVIGFVCSGGMQTKEGASALFSMAVVNDHINRFVMELELPVLIVGYGDCTGGAQASLVTHPLVDSYYFSGTNMPFAGRIVVPDYLPVTSTLSNYLVKRPGSMQGLVKHPFVDNLDERLRAIDPDICSAGLNLQELIQLWLLNRDYARPVVPDGAEVAVEESAEPVPLNFALFDTVLVHARGCTAVKLIREAQAMQLKVVLVQSDPDMDSVAADSLREGDQLVCLGGYTSEESYLNGSSVLRIAELYGAQALHPGIGFLSENHQFARECLLQNLVFVGPSPESMLAMGDKSRAIAAAMAAGVPVVPGSHGILRDAAHALEFAEAVGFPVILKAAYGGGGKGILEVHEAAQLDEAFLRIQAEGRNSFGREEIYLERLVMHFRHIEVQILRDRFGCTKILGLRDCSVQRNKQKILEESGSTLLPAEQAEVARAAAARLADACDYVGAGTVEFIYDLDQQQLYFMEMNTRLQVEHPVTERVSGVDIVREQFRIAMGKSIDHLLLHERGYAIEIRINAEQVTVDSDGRMLVSPCPGLVTACDFPERERISRIVCIGAGKSVPPFYDNLVAQVIAHGDHREQAIRLLRDYLAEIRVEGIETNIPLLLAVLDDESFTRGDFDTGFLRDFAERKRDQLTAPRGMERAGDPASLPIQVEGSDELKVFAPSSSILYRAASPSQPVYVKEGDVVTVEQTLCLLEVMKMFQPLSLASFNRKDQELYPACCRYLVTHVRGLDGQHVNQGDLLLVVKPIADAATAA